MVGHATNLINTDDLGFVNPTCVTGQGCSMGWFAELGEEGVGIPDVFA
jgi:hypothetical protein